ncbi:MAG TPA: SPOR domain-containing protein [Myxococcaceae bacterium]|nr:SPOR domain-containing protein [Myxococcaceae bacterium]
MRDSHRIKEKYELALDSKQIVSLLIGGIVVTGTVFVLGVVVGKNLAGPQRAGGAADLLSALDEKAAAMEQVRGEPKLTFQDELTKKSAPEAARPSAVEAKPIAEGQGTAGARAAAASRGAVSDTAPVARQPPPPDPGDQLAGAVERPMDEPAPRAENWQEPPSESAPAAKSQSRTASSRLKEAIARAEKKAPEPSAPAAGFTLQLAASQARAEADRFASRLRERGYAPYVVESDVPGRGKWYRVRMGRFASREAAVKYLEDFRRETQLEAFVASAN